MPNGLDISRGEQAKALLHDGDFLKQWSALVARCPWATVLQDVPYVQTWYQVYDPVYEPILISSRDANGELIGLLTLAVHRRSGALVPAGGRQAEYCVWVSLPENGNRFFLAALDSLQCEFPNGRLSFRYLPPNTPLDWLEDSGQWKRQCLLETINRPLMGVGNGEKIRDSMRKKSNKTRLKSFEKRGTLEFQRVNHRAEIERDLEDIINFCDIRQGGVNDSLPFRDDPYKAKFVSALFDVPDLLHVTVWRLNGRVISAHIGIRDRTQVMLGIITHSPFLAGESPGKMHIYLLGLQLVEEGIHDLDLTPEGGYKDRFATHYDEVHRLTVYFSSTDLWLTRIKDATLRLAKRTLSSVSLTPDRVREAVALARHRLRMIAKAGGPAQAVRSLRALVGHAREPLVYQFDGAVEQGSPHCFTIERDSLSDLLAYRPTQPLHPLKSPFLRNALSRLEQGDRAYTCVEDGVLVHYGWVRKVAAVEPPGERGTQGNFPAESLLLDELYTQSEALDRGLLHASMARILQDIASDRGASRLLVLVASDDRPTRRVLEELGFRLAPRAPELPMELEASGESIEALK